MSKLAALQNGSDIRGISLDGVEGEAVNFTGAEAARLALAFADWLAEKLEKQTYDLSVALGRDSRLSGPALLNAAAEALLSVGVRVFDYGLASTPAMFMTTVTPGYLVDGSIMFTASHLPFNRNGMKFFTAQGGLEKANITDIIGRASKEFTPIGRGERSASDFMKVYAAQLVDKVRLATDAETPLLGLKIIVDAGNGAGGFFAQDVLQPLGADTEGSQFLDPDGRFPNHIPNPENAEAMQSISDAVLACSADLGIIFDTDVDRAAAVDNSGKPISRNRLIALMSAIVLREEKGGVIVTDSITSTGLARFIEKRGGVHRRFKRGYRNVINEAQRLNKAGKPSPMAIETSGHGALRENYFLDDGAYLITKILTETARLHKEGKTLSSLIEGLEEPLESREFRLKITEANFAAAGERILQALQAYAKQQDGLSLAPDNFEGVRCDVSSERGSGWFLLRMSLHDPLMPLNIESGEKGGLVRIAKDLLEFLEQWPLDVSGIKKFLESQNV